MPGPSTIVTFTDADGDEFPIRVGGHWPDWNRPKLIVHARRRLNEFVERGELKPTEPLTGTKVEQT